MALNRPLPGQYNGPKEERLSDVQWAEEYPTLLSYLSERTYSDNKPRVTSTLLIFVDDGILRICINDRDNNRSAFVTAATFSEALASLESRLLEESLDWRVKSAYTSSKDKTPF